MLRIRMMMMLRMLTTMMDRSDERAFLHRDPHLHLLNIADIFAMILMTFTTMITR